MEQQVSAQSQGSAAAAAALSARIGVRSDRGRVRGNNEDRYLVFHLGTHQPLLTPGGKPSSSGEVVTPLTPLGVLLIVADGMGGMMSGEVASQMCVDHLPALLAPKLERTPHASREYRRTVLGEAVREAHDKIFQRAQSDVQMKGMGTTCTAALVEGCHLLVAQVGDSRAYLGRGGKVKQLTRDQTVWESMKGTSLKPVEELGSAPWKNMLMQALGAQPDLNVVISEHELEPQDWLLLCSDGLYRVVTPEDLAAELAAPTSPEQKADRLVNLANQNGGPDNITLILCQVAGP